MAPYKISVSDSFGCGTEIALSLNLTYAGGTKSIAYTVPTCAGGPDQQIPLSQLTTSDSTQQDRIGRNGRPSTCSGKISPGGGFPGTKYYKTYTFTNTAGAPRCYTVTINAALGGPGDIQSVAYDQMYDPANINANYLGDSGISGLGTTVETATYSFTVPAGNNFVVVVNTTGSATSGTIASSQFSGTVSGFIDNNAGPGDCATIPEELALTEVVSRKTHTGRGDFDIDLPLTGPRGVECRSGGANGNHTLVFTFSDPVTSCGTASNGTVTAGPAANQCTVQLTQLANAQYHQVTLNGVVDGNGGVANVPGPVFGVLFGDVDGSRRVDGGDVLITRQQNFKPVSGTNFRADVNASGRIDGGDTLITRQRNFDGITTAPPETQGRAETR